MPVMRISCSLLVGLLLAVPAAAQDAFTPPAQNDPWSPPKSKVPTKVVDAAGKLFELGLADPRGCEYRTLTVAIPGRGTETMHGWLLPAKRGNAKRHAVCWDGFVRAVWSVGPRADLAADVRAAIKAHRTGNRPEETGLLKCYGDLLDWTDVPMLLRLGEGELATALWQRALSKVEVPNAPIIVLAGQRASTLLIEGVNSHRAGEDALALYHLRLAQCFLAARDEEVKKIKEPPADRFDFGEHRRSQLGLLLRDQEKAQTPKKPVGGGPAPMPKKDDKAEEKKDDKKEEKPKAQTGLFKRTNAARDRNYWVFVPKNYDPNVSYAVVVWLHPVGKNKEADMEKLQDRWEDYCEDNHVILVMPTSQNDTGWVANEMEFVNEAIRTVTAGYTVDRRRVIAHGMGVGGQMAFYMGFAARDVIRGVATVGAVLTSNPKERVPTQPVSFFMVVGEKDPIIDSVKESKAKLTEYRYPVILRELKEKGHQYFDFDTEKTLKELVRWIDSLDRL
jgi:predicted esterase